MFLELILRTIFSKRLTASRGADGNHIAGDRGKGAGFAEDSERSGLHVNFCSTAGSNAGSN